MTSQESNAPDPEKPEIMAELKTKRGQKKSTLTRALHDIEVHLIHEEVDEVTTRLESLKTKFKQFEEVHDQYHELLKSENDILASEDYYYAKRKEYVDTVMKVKQWLHSVKTAPKNEDNRDKSEVKSDNFSEIIQGSIASLVNLPKIELEVFDGDPLKFHSFLAIFDENVHNVVTDGRMRLTRLLQYTTGRAKEAIRSCALQGGAAGYDRARKILLNRFGDDHIIAEHIIKRLKNGKPVKSPTEVRQLADELVDGQATLENMGKLRQIDTHSCILDIADRLQPYMRNRWKKHALDFKRDTREYPSFEDFVSFVSTQADEVTDPVYGIWNTKSGKLASESKKTSSSFSTDVRRQSATQRSCIMCRGDHRLLWCPQFKGMRPADRLKYVTEKRLCENCLLGNHITSECRKPSVCSVPGCGLKHTKFVHVEQRTAEPAAETSASVFCGNRRGDTGTSVCMPVVPVIVNGKQTILALLDTASNTTFCTRRLIDSLGLKGLKTEYSLNTVGQEEVMRNTVMVNFDVKSVSNEQTMSFRNVYALDKIPVDNPIVNLSNFSHLADLPVISNGEVDLLIGQDHAEALMPLEVRKGDAKEIFAVRTLLGWSLNGPLASLSSVSKKVMSHFITVTEMENENEGQTETIVTDCDLQDELGMSVEDKRVLKLWDENVKLVNGHYQVPIPFRENVCVPNNVSVAAKRLESLKSSLERKKLFQRYDDEIVKLHEKGFAEKVPVYDINRNTGVWYLPHHAVTSANKPGKIRVVFDCASKYMGQSLNEKCLCGPDLINKLQFVLLRFRNHKYAITADIEAMYHQVVVPEGQRDYLRFLWYDSEGNVDHHRMSVHVFGGVWCSSAACYALRRTVHDFDVSDDVRNAVQDSFYVDDFLISVPEVEQASKVIHLTKQALMCAGFNLTKFVINDETLLNEVPEADRVAKVKNLNSDVCSKVLGVKWDVKSDSFCFEVKIETMKATRRKMLSTISSLFDPLGLVSPVLMPGKVLLQDVTRLKLAWDDTVPNPFANAWRRWVGSLHGLQHVVIPRCVIPSEFEGAYAQLHHFSDASSQAYGSCTYLRSVTKEGRINVSLIYAKSRVAPIKNLSVPRLELQGAVLSARADVMLREQLQIELLESSFWVDSEIVLRYIHNESRRFQVYVANRVGEIQRLTEPRQWKHVPGDENPADVITRGIDSSELVRSNWFTGPHFLSQYKESWETVESQVILNDGDPEVKRVKVMLTDRSEASQTEEHPLDKLINHYSDWHRLKRALCWLLRFRRSRGKKIDVNDVISTSEMQNAELILLKHEQAKYFPDEVESLSRKKSLSKSSHIRDLLPIMDSNHLLRVGGRIKHAFLEFENKHPVILSHKSVIAGLIARDVHETAHMGIEWSLSRLRCKYWVTRARVLLRRIKGQCIVCRKLYAAPCAQKMANLPPERLVQGGHPFSVVGTDCFGPYMVKLGRSEVKRYGCLFTCFATRAIHIEVLDSMDTDSMINALRRFIARRGTPSKVYSDSGSNYIGCKNELSRSLNQLEKSKLHNFCLKQDIEWVFNPPCAPHWGGVFERMVQTIKRILLATMTNTRLSDEMLNTLMCEVENLINSRPITKVSNDACDPSALSPSHLLILRGSPSPLPGAFCVADMYRRRWKHVQHLVDVFWSRWLKEYIPMLQKASKWHEIQTNLKVNDLVLVADENTPRSLWPLGIVVDVRVSKDGLVRAVRVKTKHSELVRPVTKIVLIEGEI